MQKRMLFCLILALTMALFACAKEPAQTTTASKPSYEETHPETTADPAVPQTTVPVMETTAPMHSELYIPEYTEELIRIYFEEVVLHMEYSDGTGNPSLVQKWLEPIRYRIIGDPTEEDLAVLTDLFDQLNQVPGFPGIREAKESEMDNLTISFLDHEAFYAAFSDILNGEDAFGGVQFWYYTDTNEIYTANIGYRTDLDQSTRSSILVEEIINMLGISDTEQRTDSIVYQYSDENTTLSEIDWLILKLLYNPAIQCGMDADSCSAVIRQLYY